MDLAGRTGLVARTSRLGWTCGTSRGLVSDDRSGQMLTLPDEHAAVRRRGQAGLLGRGVPCVPVPVRDPMGLSAPSGSAEGWAGTGTATRRTAAPSGC